MKNLLIALGVLLSMNTMAQEKVETVPVQPKPVEATSPKANFEKTTVERAKMDVKTLNTRLKVAEMEQEKNGEATQSAQPAPAKKD